MSRHARIALACALAALSLVGRATPAHAQSGAAPAAAPSDDDRVEARRHFEAGVALIQQSRWREAIPELEVARARAVTPAVLYNLGLAQRAVGAARGAIRSFREFLTLAGESLTPERRAAVEGYLAELNRALAHLTVRVTPADAVVWVDGNEAAAGRSLELDPGEHSVTAQAPEHQAWNRVVNLAPGADQALEVTLRVIERPGRIDVTAQVATASVFVDGVQVGTRSVQHPVTPGRHRVEIRAQDHLTWRRTITVRSGESMRLDVTLARRPGLESNPWFWTGIGAGAVAVGAVLLLAIPVVETAQGPRTWDLFVLPPGRP